MTNPSTNDVIHRGIGRSMTQTYPIDAKRIYASGTSNGGHMSFRLAIEAEYIRRDCSDCGFVAEKLQVFVTT